MKNLLVLALAAAGMALDTFGGIRALSHDNYGGNPNAWQIRRHNEKMNVVTNGGAKVVFIGDSITHFWETSGKSQLRKYFSEGDYKMLNLGVSGDRTEHLLWRLNEGGELDGYEAKCILLMIGTNNTGHLPIEQEPPVDTILGIREVLRTIHAKQPKAMIVLSPIFPRGRDVNDPNRVRNEIVNKEICKFADGKTVFWCDFNDQFLTSDARLSPEVFPDFLHPGRFGYEIWYAAVKPYIDTALSDGRLPVPANRYSPNQRKEKVRIDQPFARYPGPCIDRRFDEADGWLDRLQSHRDQIADSKGEIDLVMLGDSITHNWELTGASSLAELRKTYTVLNAGYGGDRTENLLWRIKYGGELDGYKAKVVSLMIGTNNAGHRKDRPEDTAAAIGDILAVIAEKQPDAKVLLMPIFPCGENAQDANRVINDAVNRRIRGCADGERVIWFDFTDKFLDEKGDPVKWMADRLHPNEAGYREIWLPALKHCLEKFARKVDTALPAEFAWAGRFEKYSGNPIIRPQGNWAADMVFNPAAVVKDGRVGLICRAVNLAEAPKDKCWSVSSLIWAWSDDGIHFTLDEKPFLHPKAAWPKPGVCPYTGGFEDPRIVYLPEEKLYVLCYTGVSVSTNADGQETWRTPALIAWSKDLKDWEWGGEAFANRAVCITPQKVNGKYWAWWGNDALHMSWSEDARTWHHTDAHPVGPRKGFFDSTLCEAVAAPVMGESGILLLYNGAMGGASRTDYMRRWTSCYAEGGFDVYQVGWALFDRQDPTRLLARSATPILSPTTPFERFGFVNGTVFASGLVNFRGKWWLYYGCADNRIAVAVSEAGACAANGR